MNIKIYTTPSCVWCEKTKQWLNEHNYSYEEVDLSNKENMPAFFDDCGNDARTVPQILIDDHLIGTYSSLMRWYEKQNSEEKSNG